MVACKRDNSRCELQIEDLRIKQVQRFNYQGSLITEDGKCDTETRRYIGKAKDTSQKLNKVLRYKKISLEMKKKY